MQLNVSKLAPYAKAVVAVCGFILIVAKALVDGTVTSDELYAIGTSAGVMLGVYQVRNK